MPVTFQTLGGPTGPRRSVQKWRLRILEGVSVERTAVVALSWLGATVVKRSPLDSLSEPIDELPVEHRTVPAHARMLDETAWLELRIVNLKVGMRAQDDVHEQVHLIAHVDA